MATKQIFDSSREKIFALFVVSILTISGILIWLDVDSTDEIDDFFETVISPDGSWMGIAYQRNVDQHPFEENEEQRYIMFVRGELN